MAKEKEKDDDDKGKEPELTIVTADEQDLEVPPTGPDTDDNDVPRKKAKDKQEDDDQDADEEEQEEARLGESEEREAEQEAKDKAKATHKSRRQRQKEAERRLRTERDFLERRNEALEKEVIGLKKRMDTTDKSTLESRITYTKQQIAKAEKIHSEAIAANKGEEATEALKIRDRMQESLRRDEERVAAMQKEEREPATPPARPEAVANARGWMSRTKWFDPNLRDQDSKVVRALDIAVEEDGFDPATPEYFEELDKRIAKYLPHRVKKGKRQDAEDEDVEDLEDDEVEEETPRRKSAKPNGNRPTGGPRFRTGAPGRQLKANEVFLSPARVAAMKEMGAWDDPVLRQKYLKKYQEWDREHANENE